MIFNSWIEVENYFNILSDKVKMREFIWNELATSIRIFIGLLLSSFLIIQSYPWTEVCGYQDEKRSLADSPWPMFQGNPQHTGLSPYDTSSNPGKLTWKYSSMEWASSSPTIGIDGTIYVGSWDNYTYAINEDGTLKWKYDCEEIVDNSPAIGDDDTIYVPSYGDLYAIRSDGSLKWMFNGSYSLYTTSPVIGSDNTIYYTSDYTLYAIDSNGHEKWNYQVKGVEISYWLKTIMTSPAIGHDGTIYIGSRNNYLYAINPNGIQKWSYRTTDDISSSPTIGPDDTIYVASGRNMYAISSNGMQKWIFPARGFIKRSVAIDSDGTIYFGEREGNLYAVNSDGSEKWIYIAGDDIMSAPAVGADGNIYFGCWDDCLYSVSSEGELVWKYQTGGAVSSPAIGSDGTVYIGSGDDLLAIGSPGKLPPSQPKNLVVTDSASLLDLEWQIPDYDSDSPIMEYKIYRGDSSGTELYYHTVKAPSTDYRDDDIQKGHTYFYYVTAINEYGESEPSNTVSASIEIPDDDDDITDDDSAEDDTDDDMDSGDDNGESGGETPGLSITTVLCLIFIVLIISKRIYKSSGKK